MADDDFRDEVPGEDRDNLIPSDEHTQLNPTGVPQVPTDRKDVPEEPMNAGEAVPDPDTAPRPDSPETLDEDINEGGGRTNWP